MLRKTAAFFFSRGGGHLLALVALFCAGTFVAPLQDGVWARARERLGAADAGTLARSAGTGAALGTLGGFRTVLADFAWLRAFHFWTKSDPAACMKYAELAMTLSPEQFFFVENTANYVAFDFPVWEMKRRGGRRALSPAVRREIHKAALSSALALLEDAARERPDDALPWVRAAQISAIKTDVIYGEPDYAKAAAYYRLACGRPNAPLFAYVLYAKFVAEHVPGERGNSRAFLETCRDAAETPARREFFEELLSMFES